MKRILVSESQYSRLLGLLNEQVFIFNNKEDEKDINPEITQTLSYLSSVLGRISDKNLYIDKVENGIVYIDSSKYTQEELDLLQSKIETYISHNVNPKDKLIQNALGFDSGTDSDWTGEDIVVVDDEEEDDGSTAEVEDDSSTAEVEDDSNTATIDDEDEKIYREVEACNFGKNSKGKRRVVYLPPAMDIRFYQDILKKLGTKVTCEKMLFFFAWRDGESSESTYNPFATTYKDSANEGCYYNCLKSGRGYKPTGCRECPPGTNPGVRNYKTYESGLNATVKTLTNGRYNNVVRKLKNDNITAIEIASEKAELSVWGTGGLVYDIISYNPEIKVNRIAKYGGNSIVEEDCTLTTQEYNFYKKHIRSKSDGDAFRRWVNSDNARLNNVNRKLSDCERFDGLSPSGELNDYLELAFKFKGKEWVNSGKPESENKPVVKTKNGNFSTSELMRIIDDVNGNVEYLSKAAGTQFMKMVEDAKKDGVTIKITDAYRPCGSPGDYKKYKRGEIKFTQWVAWEDYKFHRGNLAAEPVPNNEADWNSQGGGYCTSNHGWGNALDTSGSESSKWIRKNGEKYGWFWGEASSESWHFTFCGNNVENEPRFCKNVDKSKIEASAIQTSRNDESDCPNYDCWSYFGKEDFWDGSSKINNVTVPKITISKSPTLFKITYKGKTSGFLLKHGRGGKNDTIHQLLNVLTLELNPYLKQNNLKPVIKTIKMNLSGNDLSVEVPLVNSGNKKYLIDRRGRLGGGSIDDSGLKKYKNMDGYEEASHESGNLKEKFITVITEKNVESSSDNKIGDKIIETAYTKIGEPYEWGNEFKVDKNNPDGKGGDCSGFIDWVLSNTPGITSPYNGRETSENLKNLVAPGNIGKKTGLRKGDILVFTGRIGHVAFVSKVDGGKVDMIDSGKGGVNVRTNIFNKKYWNNNYYGVIPLVNGKYESK